MQVIRQARRIAASMSLVLAAAAAFAAPSQAAPGELVSAKPVRVDLGRFGTGLDLSAWQIHYRSTDQADRPIVVSGLLVVPRTGQIARQPLVGVGHGSEGLADRCAPSRQYVAGTELETPALALLLRKGWAVVESDGQGLGTPGRSTYLVGRSSGRALLDALRAARRVRPAGLPRTSPTGLWGYSEGGSTVVWAAETQPTYAPELELAGAVAGGTPADLRQVAGKLNGSLFATFLFQAAAGLDAAYPELDLDSYLNRTGRALLPVLRGTCTIGSLPIAAGATINRFTTRNPLDSPDWQRRIAENSAGQATPRAPMYLFHAADDEILPFEQARELRDTYCARGASVTWRELAGGHFQAYITGARPAAAWLDARLVGEPAQSDCG